MTGADQTPAPVEGHAFEPKGAWWTTCKHCGLAEAAHASSTVRR